MDLKYSLLFSLFFLGQLTALAQVCNIENHSTNAADMWLSCTTSPCPNTARGTVHWQLYDLGYEYALEATKFWNYNEMGMTGKGFKEVAIDYSIDGTSWTEAATFQLTEASGNSMYEGVDGPDLTGITARYVLISTTNAWNNGNCAGLSEVRINVGEAGLFLSPKIWLEGPYNTSTNLMNDDLRLANLLPTTEPFTNIGYTHTNGGGEIVNSTVFNTTGADAIVDWVLLELRDQSNPSTILISQSALLQRDGDIVSTDGVSPLRFNAIPSNAYFITIRHRNHLGVMTSTAQPLSGILTVLDLRTNIADINGGNNGAKTIDNNTIALFSGDFDFNNQVQNADASNLRLTLGLAGYLPGDSDLNGQVQNTDIQEKTTPNLGNGAQY